MKLVLGTVQFGLNYGINNAVGAPNKEQIFSILDHAYEAGIRELDTADAYGTSQERLAEYFQARGQKFQLMSKFSLDGTTTIAQHLQNSLKRLGTSRIEGYYFHKFEDFKTFRNFDAFENLKAQGLINKLGVSLYTDDELALAAENPTIDVIQLPFNLLDSGDSKLRLMEKAKKNKKLLYARSAFLQGLFFMKQESFSGKLRSMASPVQQIQTLAKMHHLSTADLALSFVLAHPLIDKVLIGVDTVEQLQCNLMALGKAVSPELLNQLKKIKIEDPALLNPGNWK
ncbi:MAG: hypothetical protein A2X86_12335 [Bdellovibrionales bacterium GWA2_49_15]|nr:MAG: hypothetical protein A2X86_12335 [Bdellovibrionales bacterium GWA2_49_15]